VEARSVGTVKLGPAGRLRLAPALSVNARRVLRVQTLGWWPLLLAVALLALALATAVRESFPGGRSVGATHVRAHRFSRAGLQGLPVAAQGPVSGALGAEGQAYRVGRLRGRLTASSPVQHLSASFTRSGVSVRSGTTEVGLGLLAVGYGSRLAALAQVAPSAHANRVLYRHRGLEEWYANGPLGLEQGFTIPRAPSGHTDGPLTLSMLLSGNVKASLAKGGQSIVIGRAGRALLRYTGLLATDASGRALHSWFALDGGRLLLRVDAAGVRYPLRIDPLIQQGGKLTGAGEIASGRFGYSVALSADGNTALIGARYAIRNNNEAGGAWVFTRSGSTWSQQGGKLNGTGHAGETLFDHIGEGAFGYSVALSADGDTALIGAPDDNGGATNEGGVGAVWVFARSGSTWSQQGEKLTGTGETEQGEFGTGETGEGEFGYSVGLSEDGDTALIGAPGDNGGVGAVWVFARSDGVWTQQGEKLVGDCTSGCANEGTGETGEGMFATSVALSADGDTAMIGGWDDDGGKGAAWVFARSGSSWTQQGEKLVGDCTGSCANEGTGETGEGKFATSVALAEDGDTAMIGGPADNSGAGAVWVFIRSAGAWSQQGQKLTGGGESGEGEFGYSVALSEDGDTALIGGPEDDTATGGVWAFTRSAGAWSQQGQKLTGGEEGNSQFGVYVALSADGNTALIGGPGDNYDAGAAWVFTRSGGVWSQQGPKLTGRGETREDGFGVSVALSADGNTALIGAPGDNGGLFGKGAAWVFTRSDGIWTQQGEKLVGDCTESCANEGTGEIYNAWFGYNVALSADGNTALIGGFRDNDWRGAAWVFRRSGSTWSQQGEKLVGDCTSGCANQGTGEVGDGMFGTMVALSADGNTALIGAWNDDNTLPGNDHYSGAGAAWVFTRSGSTWTQQGEKLVGDCTSGCANEGTGETGEGRFGVSVALSADGDTALIAGLDDNSTRGAVWLFTRSGSTWTQQGEKLTGGGEAGEGEFATNVALSADGDTALSGAWRDNGDRGATWVFVNPPTAATGAATGVGEAGATLNGTVGAGGSSTAYFQYGTTVAYGSSTATQSVGAPSSPRALAAAIGGLAPGTTYHFRLVAENSGGVAYGGDQTFTTEARGTTSTTEVTTTPPAQLTSTSSSVPAETPLPPAVQNARESATRWREGNQLARISRAKIPTGTIFSFQLNEQAAVTFSFTQSVSGRKAGGKCVTQTQKNRRKPACTRTVTAGTLTFTGHGATNKVAFQGRVSPVKKLEPGRYTLVITATNSAGVRSAPTSLSFTIVD